MNAKWLEQFIKYRESEFGNHAIYKIINDKIFFQDHNLTILKSTTHITKYSEYAELNDVQKILLYEARSARTYWITIRKELQSKIFFPKRKPHRSDPGNRVFDIGYHTLTNYIQKRCVILDIPTDLGLFHRAQSQHSHPLAYDLIEWLRPFLVDSVIITWIHKKKRPLVQISQKDIAYIVHLINRKLTKKYFHQERGACISLSYWIDLYLLEFRNAVSEQREFNPIYPPLRHETRCSSKKTSSEETGLKS